MSRTAPQDAPSAAPTPQDSAGGWRAPTSAGDGLEAGWYASPDGSPTLSWWTGKGWSRTQQPIPAGRPVREPLHGRVVPPAPEVRGHWGRRTKGYAPAVLLTLFFGAFGLVFVNFRLAVTYWLALLLGGVLHAPIAVIYGAWFRPIPVALAVLAVAVHNHRVGGGTLSLRRRNRRQAVA